MEDALAHRLSSVDSRVYFFVLILVLMEDALARKFSLNGRNYLGES